MQLGSLIYTNSKELLAQAECYGYKPIALIESTQQYQDIPNIRNIQLGSVLLPSYEAVSAFLDNQVLLFDNLYTGQLCTRECDEFISLIFFVLSRRINIMLYINKDEMEMRYPQKLFEHFINCFGYAIGSTLNHVCYNPAFDSVLLYKFYKYDFIDGGTFLKEYPPNTNIPIDIVNKLMVDLRPMILGPKVLTPEICKQYFMDIINYNHGIHKTLYRRELK